MSRRNPREISRILTFVKGLEQLRDESGELTETPAVPYGAYFLTAQMTATMRPLIVRARREAFGRPDPPFDAAHQVNDWLLRVYYVAKKVAAYEQAMDDSGWRTKPPAQLDQASRVAAEKVRTAAQRIIDWTGWREIAALGCILLRGYKVPDTFQYRLEGPTPGDQAFEEDLDELAGVDYSLLFRRITLTVRPWHMLHPNFVQQVLEKASNQLGQQRQRRIEKLSSRDLLLMDVITFMGTMPPESKGIGYKSGGKDYWEKAARRWKAFGGPRCQPEALAKRYVRLPRSAVQTLARVIPPTKVPETHGGDSP